MTEEAGRALADELGIRFMETSAKVNEGVEEAFFSLARCVADDCCHAIIILILFVIATSRPASLTPRESLRRVDRRRTP